MSAIFDVHSDVLLLYIDKKNKDSRDAERMVVEGVDQRKRIICQVHDANHFGVNRTNDMVAAKYYWPGLHVDVKKYVSIASYTTIA